MFLMVLTSLITLSTAQAQTANLNLSPVERQAADTIRETFKPFVFTLDREMLTFHYQLSNSTSSGPADIVQLSQSASRWGRGFGSPELVVSDMAGPGHYVAIDPFGSRSFGGSNDPQLYVVPIKAGATLLNGRSSLDATNNDLFAVRKKLGCPNTTNDLRVMINSHEPSSSTEQDLLTWIAYFRNSPNISCRKVVIQALADLHIEGIIYGYSAAEVSNCRFSRTEAISIISPSAIDIRDLSFFSDQKAVDPKRIGGFVKALYEEGMKDLSLDHSISNIPTRLNDLNSNNDDYETWKAKYIFKCGPLWTGEKKELSYQLSAHFMRDNDISVLKIQVRNAFEARFNSISGVVPSLDFTRMRGFRERTAAIAGLSSLQLDTWTAAWKEFNGLDTLTRTAQILGEDSRPLEVLKNMNIDKVQSIIFKAFILAKVKPDLIFTALKKLGMGPKFSLLFALQQIDSANGIPFVTGKLPLTPHKNYQLYMARNKMAYMAYLRGCLQQYQDPNVTMEQIDAGACGMIPN